MKVVMDNINWNDSEEMTDVNVCIIEINEWNCEMPRQLLVLRRD